MQSTHLPASWVESLFGKLAALYGDQFLRKWEHVPKADLLQTWAEGLGPYADDGEHRGQRLKWALSQLRDNNPFPPSLPQMKHGRNSPPRSRRLQIPWMKHPSAMNSGISSTEYSRTERRRMLRYPAIFPLIWKVKRRKKNCPPCGSWSLTGRRSGTWIP